MSDELERPVIPMTRLQGEILLDLSTAAKQLEGTVPMEVALFLVGRRTAGNLAGILRQLVRCRWLHRSGNTYRLRIPPPTHLGALPGPGGDHLSTSQIKQVCEQWTRGIRPLSMSRKEKEEKVEKPPKPPIQDSKLNRELAATRGNMGKTYSWGQLVANHLALEQRVRGALSAEVSHAFFTWSLPDLKAPMQVRWLMNKECRAFDCRPGRNTSLRWRVRGSVAKAVAALNIRPTLSDAQLDEILNMAGTLPKRARSA